MSMKTDTDEVWNELEAEMFSSTIGILKRIISQSSLFRLYLGINTYNKMKLLIIEFPIQYTYLFDEIINFKGINIHITYNADAMIGCNTCIIETNNSDSNYIFRSFVENIIYLAEKSDKYEKYTSNIVNRIKLWKIFFEDVGCQVLSKKQQIGLFGELDLLSQLIQEKGSKMVQFWKGPSGAAQDFQFVDIAIEVKTTTNEYKNSITISNCKQLDKENYKNLYLCFNVYAVLQSEGMDLPTVIENIYHQIKDSIWEDVFTEKLLQQGYINTEGIKYNRKFVLRNRVYYTIESTFPKIICSDLPIGVLDLTYEIDLLKCENSIVKYSDILLNIMS